MGTELKYVVVEDYGIESLILLAKFLAHRSVVHVGVKVLSAGFCTCVDGKWKAYGRSESLSKDSRPEADTILINKLFSGD